VADFNFVATKLHPPNKFAVSRSLRRRDYLGLRWFAAPRALTSDPPGLRFSEREKYTANLALKPVLLALALAAKLHFATSLGGGGAVHSCTPSTLLSRIY
jgi:hypothetical protein